MSIERPRRVRCGVQNVLLRWLARPATISGIFNYIKISRGRCLKAIGIMNPSGSAPGVPVKQQNTLASLLGRISDPADELAARVSPFSEAGLTHGGLYL